MTARDPHEATLDLVRRARAGDVGALDDVVARTYPRVEQLVRRRLGPGLRRFAESGDVVQEAMGELVRGLDGVELEGEDALVRWLATVVENRLRMLARHHRSQKRDGQVVSLEGLVGPDGDGTGDPARATRTPLEKASAAEDLERLQAAIASLEPGQRALIDARRRGETWEVVAARLGITSAGAARMQHARALAALTHALGRGSTRDG